MNQLLTILLIIILIFFITKETQIEKFVSHPMFKYNDKLFLSGENDNLIVTNKPTKNFQIIELSNGALYQMKFNDKYIMPICISKIYDDKAIYIPYAKNAKYDSKRNDEYVIRYDKNYNTLYYEFTSILGKKIKRYFVVDENTKNIHLDSDIVKASKFKLE